VSYPCAILVYDRRATREQGRVVFRPCGAATWSTVSMGGQLLFAACSRHPERLAKAGVRDA
jgi:pimeloyl-ACP methyl ester carboxylesterase